MLKRVLQTLGSRIVATGVRCASGAPNSVGPRNRVGIIGVPFNKGQSKSGVEDGPRAIRENGIVQDLEDLNLDVKDYGDVIYTSHNETLDGMLHLNHFVGCNQELSNRVERMLKNKRRCLALGGDHSMAVGSVIGHLKALGEDNVALIWVDTHADLNTNKSSYTGHIHGMPAGILARELKEDWPVVPGMEWMDVSFPLKNLCYIGLHSVDNFERKVINKSNVPSFFMSDIQRYGIEVVVKMALDKVDPTHDKSIHVSFDVDALDKLEAPSTGTAVRGGMTLREVLHVMEMVHQTNRLDVMDVVELNPSLGDAKDVAITLEAVRYTILAAFGHSRIGYNPKEPLY